MLLAAPASRSYLRRMPTSFIFLGAVGRTAVEGAHRVILDTIHKGSHANFMLRSIRFVRADVAVVFARMQLKFKADNESREIETRPTLIVVKEQENWQIVAF